MLYNLIVFQKVYDFLFWLKPTVQRFTKVHKYSLGVELEKETMDLIKQIVRANLKRNDKVKDIDECLMTQEKFSSSIQSWLAYANFGNSWSLQHKLLFNSHIL